MGSDLRRRYPQALARVTASLGVPFGYTLTVWASGALATHYFGVPDVAAVVCFVGGAVAVYVTFGVIEFPDVHPVEPLRTRRVVLFNAVPVVAAALVAAVDRFVEQPLLGWLLSGAAASAAYVLLLAWVWTWDPAPGEPPQAREQAQPSRKP